MERTGIVRKVDKGGFVSLPYDLCKKLEIETKTTVSIKIEDGVIKVKKHDGSLSITRNINPPYRLTIPTSIMEISGLGKEKKVEFLTEDPDTICIRKWEGL